MTFNLIQPLPIKGGSVFGEDISRPHPAWYLQTEEVLQDGWVNHSNNQEEHTGCGLILVTEPRLCCQDGELAGGIPCLIIIITKLIALAAPLLPSLICS